MKITKKTTKSVKANAEIDTSYDIALNNAAAATDGLIEPVETIDFEFVRNDIKALIDYLSQFDSDCAKETVGNLAYIYLDLTECDK